MKEISSKVLAVEEVNIRKMFDLAQGIDDVVSLVIGEPDFTTPKNIIDAAKKSLDEGHTHYTPNLGIEGLRNAVSQHFKQFDQVDYDPKNEILVTAGGMQGIYLSLLVLTNPGDEVIISDPCYANYYGMLKLNDNIPVPVPVYEEDGFNLTEENLRKAITPKTKVIIVNTPSNPTGAVSDYETLERIAKVAVEHDLYVIFDEVYKHLIYDDVEFFNIARFPGMRERTIIVDSVSKSHAMTGWRVGFCLAPSEIISQMSKSTEFIVSCVNTTSQYAAIEALEGPQDATKEMNEKYRERREIIVNGINRIDKLSCLKPKGAFYVFVNIKETGLTSEEFAMRILKEQRVVVAPGNGFGKMGEGYIRLSYATSIDNIHEGLSRIEKFVEILELAEEGSVPIFS